MSTRTPRSLTQGVAIRTVQRPTGLIAPPSPKAPRIGHKKSRKGCAQCKRRHVKCNEAAPCSNCIRHGVACSLAGGPYVPRDDAKNRRQSATSSSSNLSKTNSKESASVTPIMALVDSRGTSPSRRSPFHALTGQIDRHIPVGNENWIVDLQLMHYYMTYTKHILTETRDDDFILQVWQFEVPKVAFEFDYVMHALLGFSALHKAHAEVDNAQRLRESAVQHLDKALVLHRSDPTPTTAENANAKFIFTWLVALFAYAIPPSLAPIDAMVELFMLVRGIDASLAETWFWVSQGPFAPILTRGFQEAIAPQCEEPILPDGMDFGLGHLDFMLGVDAMLPEDRRTCALILGELKQAYELIVKGRETASVATILCFPKQDSTKFSHLIKRRVPQALIILAYYCVLLDILDTRWWIHGWSTRVLRDVLGSVGEQWQSWIDWPVQCILIRPHPAPIAPPTGTAFIA